MKRRDYDPETILLLEMLTRWRIIELGVVLALEQVAPGENNQPGRWLSWPGNEHHSAHDLNTHLG